MRSTSSLLENLIFKDALAEITALGFEISDKPGHESIPYGVIGGRSNQRWWLVPLNDRRLTISGLALFQPVVTSARLLKSSIIIASRLGFSTVWARNKIYISGKSKLVNIFDDEELCYAFFTGTDSPHRKVAVQLMDKKGRIKGFAKVTKNAAVKKLLKHEAKTLNHLNTLDLQTVLIPKVLFCGKIGGVETLVTDSLKTARTKTVTDLTLKHITFLHELAIKTEAQSTVSGVTFVDGLRKQYDSVSGRLTVEWRRRIENALRAIEGLNLDFSPQKLSHGDFTPWNTFFVGGKLYVFDWEYASYGFSVGYDIIHFIFSQSLLAHQSVPETIKNVLYLIGKENILSCEVKIDRLLLSYLCSHTLQYILRDLDAGYESVLWDGEKVAAIYIDAIVS